MKKIENKANLIFWYFISNNTAAKIGIETIDKNSRKKLIIFKNRKTNNLFLFFFPIINKTLFKLFIVS